MKRKILILVIGIFLVSFAIGGIGLLAIDRQIDLNLTQETSLSSKGINNWTYEDHETNDEMRRCLISPSDYNLPCSEWFETYYINCSQYNITYEYHNETILDEFFNESSNKSYLIENGTIEHQDEVISGCLSWERIDYTDEEKLDILNSWEDERMADIADVIKMRADRNNATLFNEGEVTIRRGQIEL